MQCKNIVRTILCQKQADEEAPDVPELREFIKAQQDKHSELGSDLSTGSKRSQKKKKKTKKKKKKRKGSSKDGASVEGSDIGSDLSASSAGGSKLSGDDVSDVDGHSNLEPIQEENEETKDPEVRGGIPRKVEVDPMPMENQDEILQNFISKLKAGQFKVKKHGRAGKPKGRTLKLSDDEQTLYWLPNKMLFFKRKRRTVSPHHTEYHRGGSAQEIDRQNPRFLGTPVLRRSCEPAAAARSLSIIWDHRTLDLEFQSEEACTEFLNGMRMLVTKSSAAAQM
eukprot:CAMPEP_0194708050 /NCGR_PEP_ID=MMETSP0296-20130528/1026_1 /TAXON_ID=39354 /ORGANISM="Heterosigma akashiwo, Strain CCMP2393" /LENGTH=280 /DNA_ID=CAMNT_0039604655 /DNA_START=97 /DNA_END=940 /DNA_ORIENTATION=+